MGFGTFPAFTISSTCLSEHWKNLATSFFFINGSGFIVASLIALFVLSFRGSRNRDGKKAMLDQGGTQGAAIKMEMNERGDKRSLDELPVTDRRKIVNCAIAQFARRCSFYSQPSEVFQTSHSRVGSFSRGKQPVVSVANQFIG